MKAVYKSKSLVLIAHNISSNKQLNHVQIACLSVFNRKLPTDISQFNY